MKPTYEVEVWQEDDWWLARVVTASHDADPTPLNAITQARSLTRIEQMARDLIATILDADERTFDIELEYLLPDDVGELLCEAKGARAWLDAAQELWQERSAVAARTLTGKGYSLREVAKLLGLSHQRVDQLLQGDVDTERRAVWAVELKRLSSSSRPSSHWAAIKPLLDVDLMVVVRNTGEQGRRWISNPEERDALQDQLATILADCAELNPQRSVSGTREVQNRRIDA